MATTDGSTFESPGWEHFRDAMPVAEKWAYFDHAAVAPLSGPAGDVLARWSGDMVENGAVNWSDWNRSFGRLRRRGEQLLNASPGEVAVIRNTTEGINIVAMGFPWRSGDNVVTLDNEFPTNRFPWMNLSREGVETRFVQTHNGRVDLNELDDALDERTRILAVSWVGYDTGWRNDVKALAEIAHRHAAYFLLDAIQGLGVFPIDVKQTGVDFLAADGHKWMLGPEGTGLFFLREEHLDLLHPVGIGWNSVNNAADFSAQEMTLKQTAARYEGGSYHLGGVAALDASLGLLQSFSVDRIANRLLDLTDKLCRRLEGIGAHVVSCRDGERRSGIVAFDLPGADPLAAKRGCLGRGVILNARSGHLRISPHAYTNEDDIERLFEALADCRSD